MNLSRYSECRPSAYFVLLATTLFLYLAGTATIPLIDRDEPRFAHATAEMMDRDEWLVPYFNGEFRFDKPVLTYWCMRIFYNLGGINELASRLHSVFFTLFLAIALYEWARKLVPAPHALGGAFMWLTCLQVLLHGRLSVADMPMVFFVTLSMWAIFELLHGESPRADALASRRRATFWFCVLYISQGLGFLAKGPIVQLIPIVALLLYRFVFYRAPIPWKNLRLWPGMLLAFAIVALWGFPALLQTKGEFWQVGMQEHVIERGYKVFNSRTFFFFFYFLTAPLSLLPWSLLLAPLLLFLRDNWEPKERPLIAFLAAWFLSSFVIFTFYATQLPHYIMPGFPAFFMLLALMFSSERFVFPKWDFSAWLGIALITCLAGGMLFLTWGSSVQILGLAIALFLFSLLALWACFRFKAWLWCAMPVMLMAACLVLTGTYLRTLSPIVAMEPIMSKMPPGTVFVGEVFHEPGLVFYSRNHWQWVNQADEAFSIIASKHNFFWVRLKSERRIEDILKQSIGLESKTRIQPLAPLPPDSRRLEISGLNIGRTSWVTLEISYR